MIIKEVEQAQKKELAQAEIKRYEIYEEVVMQSVEGKEVSVLQLRKSVSKDMLEMEIQQCDNEIAQATNRKALLQVDLDAINELDKK